MTDSILERARAEGFRAGRADANARNAQTRMAGEDDAFYRGQCDAWAAAPSRSRWFLLGLLCGLVPAFWWLPT